MLNRVRKDRRSQGSALLSALKYSSCTRGSYVWRPCVTGDLKERPRAMCLVAGLQRLPSVLCILDVARLGSEDVRQVVRADASAYLRMPELLEIKRSHVGSCHFLFETQVEPGLLVVRYTFWFFA